MVQRQLLGGDDVRRESGVKPELLTKQVLFCILGSWLNHCAWNIQDFGKGEGMFVQNVLGNFLNIGTPVQSELISKPDSRGKKVKVPDPLGGGRSCYY